MARDLRDIKNSVDGQEKPIPAVLVVEDDPDDAMMEQYTLGEKGMGAKVTVATTGDQALELLRSCHPLLPCFDIIFLDMNLSGSIATGEDVLAFVRKTLPQIHVYIVSGDLEPGRLQELVTKYGHFGVVKKPLEKVDAREIFEKHHL